MPRSTSVNVLSDPAWTRFRLRTAEAYPNRQASRNAADRLVEEARMACPKFTHEFVHSEFKCFRIFERDDPLSRFLRDMGPVCSVEPRVEILLRDFRRCLVENLSALSERQVSRK